MNSLFSAKKVLIVGGTSGMGLETARIILSEGGSAVLIGSRPEKAQQAQAMLEPLGNVEAMAVDLMDSTEVAHLRKTLNPAYS